MRRETLATALTGGIGEQVVAVTRQLLLYPAFGINSAVVHLLQSGTWFTVVAAGSASALRATPKAREGLK